MIFLFTLAATCDRIAIISLTFQPTAIQRICLRVLVFKHTMYISTNSNPTHFFAGPCGQKHYVQNKKVNFWHQRSFVFHLMKLPQCDKICHLYSKYRCVPTPRPPRVRPCTIPFTITSIIVSLPRSRGESDYISLPRSVMRMCLIMMLNLLLFPRFCFRFCLFLHEQHNSLEPFPNAHTRSRPTSIGD